MTIYSTLPASILSFLLLAGCQNRGSFSPAQETTKFSIEGTEKFARLDGATQAAITCTGLQERLDHEGHLEVIANLRNRGSGDIRVQTRCVFKDSSGFTTGDETAWQILVLGSEATEAVRFNASNGLAHKYTVVVRLAP